ncbi:MAG: NAD(P)-dependent oxidoreductase [Gammaproteobacteria bacterium]|nr:NAD(P)-dependent oxidoreductase [Gammaproteobacteria bacterium]
MLTLVYVGGLGMMAGPASVHLTPLTAAQVLRVHDRGTVGDTRDQFRTSWKRHGAELVSSFDDLIGDGNIDGVVVCAGKNGDDLPIIANLTHLLEKRTHRPAFILHMSTVSPAFAESATRFCHESGVTYANYPLTGGPIGARLGGGDAKGMLILASGQKALFERLLPTLRLLGHPKFFGLEPSAGAVTKLIGQHLVFNGLTAISAATAIHSIYFNEGKIGGAAQADYLGFLNGGAGGTRQWDVAMKKGVEDAVWDSGFLIPHAVVDAIYAAKLALDCKLPRFAVQSIINVAYVFSFLLDQYPRTVLATHAIVREMVSAHSAMIDQFMVVSGAYSAEVEDALAACIESLPERVRETVLIEPRPEYFRDAAGRS